MANADLVRGLRPRYDLTGYQPQIRRYYATDSTAIFVGDAVKLAGGASADGRLTVSQAAASDPIVGVVVGVDQVDGVSSTNFSLYRRHRPASVNMYINVIDDPNCLFEIQCDDEVETIAAADGSLNADLIVGSGDTATGESGMELDSNTADTTATLQLKIVDWVRSPDNELFSSHQKAVVKINNHQYGSHTGTAGVS